MYCKNSKLRVDCNGTEDKLYELNITKVHGVDTVNLIQLSKKDGVLELWHWSRGHFNLKSVRALQSMVNDMNLESFISIVFSLVCEVCIEGKSHKIIFTNNGPLEIVHLGMCSPMKTSVGTARYVFTIMNDLSRKM